MPENSDKENGTVGVLDLLVLGPGTGDGLASWLLLALDMLREMCTLARSSIQIVIMSSKYDHDLIYCLFDKIIPSELWSALWPIFVATPLYRH